MQVSLISITPDAEKTTLSNWYGPVGKFSSVVDAKANPVDTETLPSAACTAVIASEPANADTPIFVNLFILITPLIV